MDRRSFLKTLAGVPFLSGWIGQATPAASAAAGPPTMARVRPRDPGWPTEARWNSLSDAVGGQLVRLDDPLAACRQDPGGAACEEFFRTIRNPYFISDDPALTETSGWVDAWTSKPSAYAVKAREHAKTWSRP